MTANYCCFIGNLVADIELKSTQNSQVANFTLAVPNFGKNDDGKRNTTFVDCVIWGERAQILAKYCHKGNKIAVSGEYRKRAYEKEGEKRWISEIIVNDFELIDNNNKTSEKSESKNNKVTEKNSEPEIEEIEDEEELPF